MRARKALPGNLLRRPMLPGNARVAGEQCRSASAGSGDFGTNWALFGQLPASGQTGRAQLVGLDGGAAFGNTLKVLSSRR